MCKHLWHLFVHVIDASLRTPLAPFMCIFRKFFTEGAANMRTRINHPPAIHLRHTESPNKRNHPLTLCFYAL